MMDVNDSWLEALAVLDNNREHQGVSFKNMSAVGTDHLEPDAVIGVAYLEYMAYSKTGDAIYLDAAMKCMTQANRFQFSYQQIHELGFCTFLRGPFRMGNRDR